MAGAFEASGAVRIDLLATSGSAGFYRSLPHQEFSGFRIHPRYIPPAER